MVTGRANGFEVDLSISVLSRWPYQPPASNNHFDSSVMNELLKTRNQWVATKQIQRATVQLGVAGLQLAKSSLLTVDQGCFFLS